MVFDGCVTCMRTGAAHCERCRKSLVLRGTNWKMLSVDGSVHNDSEMPAGTRVVVENQGYGIGTIDGFRQNVVGANNHSLVFDGCISCQESGALNCVRCRKSLQLRDMRWSVLMESGESRGDDAMVAGTRIEVEEHGYGVRQPFFPSAYLPTRCTPLHHFSPTPLTDSPPLSRLLRIPTA